MVPVAINGINTAVAVSAGNTHSCAVLADGTLQCWGAGQLGNGTTTNSSAPATVSGISTAVAVSAGNGHTCAVLTDDTVRCWGNNNFGQLGDGTTATSLIPVPVSGINPRTPPTFLPLTWTSSNTSVATITATGKLKALSLGTTTITVSLNGISTSTTVTVVPTTPTLTGFWPGYAKPGSMIFVFGSNFVPNATQVAVNGVNQPVVQVLDKTLLVFSPTGATGPITVNTATGSATSGSSFGVPLTGLQITGVWPGRVKPNSFVFVFGSGFDPIPGNTRVSINGLPSPLMQTIDPTLLVFRVPGGATSGPVTVGVNGQTATSGTALTIVSR